MKIIERVIFPSAMPTLYSTMLIAYVTTITIRIIIIIITAIKRRKSIKILRSGRGNQGIMKDIWH